MKQLFFLISISFILTDCNSPKILFKTDCIKINKSAENKYLSQMKANSENYSVLIFTQVFDDSRIVIYRNGKILYNNVITSNRSLGLAESIKVDNIYNIKIVEGKYDFILKKEYLGRYKYIYIEKNQFKKRNQYKIIYSNTLCGFM